MAVNIKYTNIIQSFKKLKGNTRTTIIFEPMYGIPFVLYNFYLSLYMKSQGITDRQIGYLISLGFVSTAVLALFAGLINDRLGRKKTTFIFDFIAWPVALLIYALSNNFWLFALGIIVNGASKIASVGITLMMVEDAEDEQRIAAFNMQNIINISSGIITPLGGILVAILGIVHAERIFLIFGFISMVAMVILRNRAYTETSTGRQILERRSGRGVKNTFHGGLYRKTFKTLREKPDIAMIVLVIIMFNLYIPIGAYSSLYFAPYMTEVLKIDKSSVSILGGVISATMLFGFVFVNPVITRFRSAFNLIVGLLIQATALFLFTVIPENNLPVTALCTGLYALGFSVFKPFGDAMLAQVTEGAERSGIYALINSVTALLSSILGAFSGYIYALNPRLIYMVSIVILLINTCILTVFVRRKYIHQVH